MTLCERCGNYPNICGCAEVDALEAQLADVRERGVWEVTSYAALMNEHVALQGRCTYLAARLAEAELSRDSWKREAEMNAEFGDQLHAALETLKAHSIHLTEKWCWCGPTVESHADSAELVQK